MIIKTPISVGELLDKITILQIKSQYSNNSYILKELQDLTEIAKEHQVYNEQDLQALKEVNEKLWVIEDEIRQLEKHQDFSSTFIELARQVYITNDQRALIKKQINERTNSTYSEVKLH
jgi:nicotinic acid phosphoribosyltransferase